MKLHLILCALLLSITEVYARSATDCPSTDIVQARREGPEWGRQEDRVGDHLHFKAMRIPPAGEDGREEVICHYNNDDDPSGRSQIVLFQKICPICGFFKGTWIEARDHSIICESSEPSDCSLTCGLDSED